MIDPSEVVEAAVAAAGTGTGAGTPIPITIEPTTLVTTSTPLTVRNEKPERNLWREQEMLTVLQIIREKKFLPLLNDKTVRSETVFRKVEKEMNDRGFNKKNFQQIWTKWKFLKSTYMTSRRVHQIPKIIPLDVYESLDELLTSEFQNDGSMSSYDGGDYGDGDGGGMGSSYEMNASASTSASNDGLFVISSVQGGMPPSSTVFNGGGTRNYPDLNGFGGMRRKFKNGFRSMKTEEESNGFGMQHPIFGYRLGVVKDEPIDDEYETNNNTQDEEPLSNTHIDEPSSTLQYPDVKPELASPPPSPRSSEENDFPVPVMQLPPEEDISRYHSEMPSIMIPGAHTDSHHMPPLHRYTPPPFIQPHHKPETIPQLPPALKQMPLMKITIPPKPQVEQITPLSRAVPPSPVSSTDAKSKKIPVLTLRKRKKRLNIPELSEGTNSPAPSSKHSKISEEDDPKETPSETSRISFLTYGKAMREMSTSLREIQRELVDDFFKQQMDLAKSEHEFQKQQDAMLLRCFEDQTKMLLDGAKRLLTNGQADLCYINNE